MTTVSDNPQLKVMMDSLTLKYGKNTIMMADSNETMDIERISTGHYEIDEQCGGGIPRGRITEVYGPESSGKTTLALQVIRESQRAGLRAALIDVEQAIGFEYCTKMGIDLSKLLFSQPGSAEEALEIAEVMMKSGQVDLIVVDSVAAMATRRELEGAVGDEHVAELARIMSKELKKSLAVIKKNKVAIIFINQIRDKPAVKFGKKSTTPGGRALKFYASLRLEIVRLEAIYQTVSGDKFEVGQLNQIESVKSKVGPPKRKLRVELRYAIDLGNGTVQAPGYDAISNLIDTLVDTSIITKKKAYFTMQDGTQLLGKDAVREFLQDKTMLAKYLDLIKK